MLRLILPILFVLLFISFSTKAQIGRDWEAGCYYDTLGHKVEGQLNTEDYNENIMVNGENFIYFRKTKKDKKIKVYADSLRCFVIATDSFTVSRDTSMAKARFLQVKLNGNSKLYFQTKISKAAMYGGGLIQVLLSGETYQHKSRYLFGPDPEHLTGLFKDNFIETMSGIMADKPDVVKAIQTKKFKMGDIEDLIYFYINGKKRPEPQYNDN